MEGYISAGDGYYNIAEVDLPKDVDYFDAAKNRFIAANGNYINAYAQYENALLAMQETRN